MICIFSEFSDFSVAIAVDQFDPIMKINKVGMGGRYVDEELREKWRAKWSLR